jgi:transposase
VTRENEPWSASDEKLEARLAQAQRQLVAALQERDELLHAHRLLQLEIARLKAELFGPKSEKLTLEDHQLPLLEEVFQNPGPAATEDVVVPPEIGRGPRQPVRRPLPEHLEVVEERIEPAETLCPECGSERCVIREECSERLDLIPARLIRRRTIRPVLACRRCKEVAPVQAPMPPQVIEKGLCGPGLLGHVLTAKYLEHRPLYRVQQELERHGVAVSRATLCGWVEAAAVALQPLWRGIQAGLMAGDYLQIDETPVRVLDPEVPGQAATGYLWVYGRPKGDVLFDFRPGRGREGPETMLGPFSGTIQTDAYGVYPSLARSRPGLARIGCLAHARRKFHEALGDDPDQARWFLLQFARLYWIERQTRHAEEGTRLAQRQLEAPPLWAAIRQRLEALDPARAGSRVVAQSPLGKAVRYALAEWDALQGYLTHGRFEIDNNLIENALRPTCVGKKNWLFIGHPEAGWRSAVIYTLIVSARRHGHDPVAYLGDVLRRIPTATQQTLHELFPANWKPLPL